MRTFATLILVAFCTAAGAEEVSPRGAIIGYECTHAPSDVGFTCSFNHANGYLHFQWHEKLTDMSDVRRERAWYEYSKLAVRYFELGGKSFDMHYDFWPANQVRQCSHIKGRPAYSFTCSDLKD